MDEITMLGHARSRIVRNAITLSNTTETTLLAAGGENTCCDLTFLAITNTNTLTPTRVDIRDSTGGTVQLCLMIEAGKTLVMPFSVPYLQATFNAPWTAQLGTAISSVRISAVAVKAW